jgi:hypothetical protein
MTTAIASGLGATWGFTKEATVGTFTTSGMRWLPFVSDKMKGEKKTVDSPVIHGGLYELGTRRRLVFHGAKGAVEFELQNRQLGLLLQAMIGSTPTIAQQGATAAYLQTHVPGDTQGTSFAIQAGRPQVGGTIQQFNYNGCKVTEWELSLQRDQIAKLTVTWDGWDENTTAAYAAPSYVASTPLAFVDGAVLLGGSVTSTAGVITSWTGAAAPSGTIESISIKGQNVFDVERQTIGSLTKAEQIANGFRKYSGQMVVEFANLTDLYAAYYADTPLSLQLNIQGSLISGTYYNLLQAWCPYIKLNGEPPETDGPAILKVTVPFDILDDGAGDPPIQFNYQSIDTSV